MFNGTYDLQCTLAMPSCHGYSSIRDLASLRQDLLGERVDDVPLGQPRKPAMRTSLPIFRPDEAHAEHLGEHVLGCHCPARQEEGSSRARPRTHGSIWSPSVH